MIVRARSRTGIRSRLSWKGYLISYEVMKLKMTKVEMAFILSDQHRMMQEMLGILKGLEDFLSVKQKRRLSEMSRRVDVMIEADGDSLLRKHEALIEMD